MYIIEILGDNHTITINTEDLYKINIQENTELIEIFTKIIKDNNFIINEFFKFTKKDNKDYYTNNGLKKYITIWDIFKIFAPDNINIKTNMGEIINQNYENLVETLESVIMNIYQKRHFKPKFTTKEKLELGIQSTYNKKENLRKDIIKNIINMSVVEYFNNNDIILTRNDLKSIKLYNIPKKQIDENLNFISKLIEHPNTYNYYNNYLNKQGLSLYSDFTDNSTKLYILYSLGEVKSEEHNQLKNIVIPNQNKFNIPYLQNTNTNLVTFDGTNLKNALLNNTLTHEVNVQYDTKLLNNLNEYGLLDPVIQYIPFINNESKNTSIYTQKYMNYVKYLVARYSTDIKYISYRNLIYENTDIEQKELYKTLLQYKYIFKDIYKERLSKISKSFIGKNNTYNVVRNGETITIPFKELTHFEKNLYYDITTILDTDNLYNEYNTTSEINTDNNFTESNIDVLLKSNLEKELNNLKKVIVNNDYLAYLIPLDLLAQYINLLKLKTCDVGHILKTKGVSDYVYSNKVIKLYSDETISKIAKYKQEYKHINNTYYDRVYKTELINKDFNITFKLKDLNNRYNKFLSYKENFNLIDGKLDISNIVDTFPFISMEDIKNICNKYKDVFISKIDTNIVHIEQLDLTIPINIDYLIILVYQKCYNNFKYIIPFKRKIDVFINNTPENYKLDIIMFNDISNTEELIKGFIKNIKDLKIPKSKYKYAKELGVKEAKFKKSKADRDFIIENIDYDTYLDYKYKKGYLFDTSTKFTKDLRTMVKINNNRFYKVFTINTIEYPLMILDVNVNNDNISLEIGGNILKNIQIFKTICYTLYNIRYNIAQRFDRLLEFKNFNERKLSFDVYEKTTKLGIVSMKTIVDKDSQIKTLEYQLINLITKQ